MAYQYSNNPSTTLSGAVTAGATSISVVSGATFPTRGKFTILVDSEIMHVTGVSGTTWTVERGAEGTAAAAHNNNAAVTGILSKSSLLNAHRYDVRAFGAVGDGVANDAAAIQSALNAAVAGGVPAEVFLPPGTFLIGSGLTVNATYVSLVGKGSKLNASSILTGAAVTITGTAAPPYNQAVVTPLSGIEIVGPGRAQVTSVGVLFNTTSAGAEGPSHVSLHNVVVHDFGNGYQFKDSAHNITLYNCEGWECGNVIDAPAAPVDGGERIVFVGCTFFNSGLAVSAQNSNGELLFVGCSFDYNAQQIYVNDSRVYLYGCHIEATKTTYTAVPIMLDGSALFRMDGGWMLENDAPGPSTIGYVVDVDTNSKAIFDGVFINNMQTASGHFATGAGRVLLNNCVSNATSQNPRILSSGENRLADGGFEAGVSLLVDDIFIVADSVAITNRTNGTNIDLDTSIAEANTGTQSLLVTKAGAAGTAAKFAIAVPVRSGSHPAWQGFVRKAGAQTGTLRITNAWALMRVNGDGVPTVGRSVDIATQTITFTAAAAPWTKYTNGEPTIRTPAWATHFLVTFDLNDMAAGNLYFDDFIITEM